MPHGSEDFAGFARARAPHLYRSAWLLCGDPQGAEDLVQETLAQVYVRWHRRLGTPIENPVAYAETTLVRTFISAPRRRSSRERPVEMPPDAGHVDGGADLRIAVTAARGRARRRRHLAATAVAVVATFSVVGVAAAIAPQLRPDPTRVTPAAGDTTPTPTPTQPQSPAPTPTPTPATSPLSQPGQPTVPAADIPRRVDELLPGHDVSEALTDHPYPLVDRGDEKVVHSRVDGMLTTVIISRASASLAHDCGESTVQCREVADGAVLQIAQPATNDGVTMRDVLALGQVWMVDVMSYNAAEGKDAVPIQPEPALGEQDLVRLASSDAWLE